MKPDEAYNCVHPRLWAEAAIRRANAAMSAGARAAEREHLTEALAWYMRCANEGWHRVGEMLCLGDAKLERWKARERLRLPPGDHVVDVILEKFK